MSEKDQEQFMKHTPVEGAPQFDVAAPAFVPKEEAEDLVVPEASGLSVTETEAMKEEADKPAISEAVELQGWMKQLLDEHPDVVAAPNRLLHSSLRLKLLKTQYLNQLVRKQCLFLRHLFHKLLFLLLEDRWILLTRRRFVLPLEF